MLAYGLPIIAFLLIGSFIIGFIYLLFKYVLPIILLGIKIL